VRASVSTWLFTIADNCVTDFLRAAGRRRLMLESDAIGRRDDDSASGLDSRSSPDLDPAETAARRESQGRAAALLDCLPEKQRRVVALKILGGLTLAEVAAVVGCPVGTAKSRLLYGLRKIEASLSERGRRGHDQ
jgi:RNA polymerase sigma-70 factor (ECF subfamily)